MTFTLRLASGFGIAVFFVWQKTGRGPLGKRCKPKCQWGKATRGVAAALHEEAAEEALVDKGKERAELGYVRSRGLGDGNESEIDQVLGG